MPVDTEVAMIVEGLRRDTTERRGISAVRNLCAGSTVTGGLVSDLVAVEMCVDRGDELSFHGNSHVTERANGELTVHVELGLPAKFGREVLRGHATVHLGEQELGKLALSDRPKTVDDAGEEDLDGTNHDEVPDQQLPKLRRDEGRDPLVSVGENRLLQSLHDVPETVVEKDVAKVVVVTNAHVGELGAPGSLTGNDVQKDGQQLVDVGVVYEELLAATKAPVELASNDVTEWVSRMLDERSEERLVRLVE